MTVVFSVEFRIKRVVVSRIQLILGHAECIAEAYKME